jgi:hypothetical protein
MMQSPQSIPSDFLTESQLITIEMGWKWMRENQTWFARKLYERFFRKLPYIREPLLAMGYPAFQHTFLRAFDSLGLGLRICRSLQSTRKEHWVTPVLEFIPPMHRDRFDQLAETFLEVLAEVVEDAWCPAVEAAWRTAIRGMKDELVESGKMGTFLS